LKVIVCVLVLLMAMVMWAFFNFPPAYAEKRALRVFNWTAVAVLGMLSAAYTLNINVLFSTPTTEKFRLLFIFGGVFAMEFLFLAVVLVLRNYWIFKARRPGSRYF
jgi:hypothetical protein